MVRTWEKHPLGWRIVEDMSRLPLVQDKIIEHEGGLVPDLEMQHEGCSKRKRKLREEQTGSATESRVIYEPELDVQRAMKKRLKELRAKAKRMAGE